MTHETLSLEEYWKLFPATLKGFSLASAALLNTIVFCVVSVLW